MAQHKKIGAIYGLGTKCGLYEKGNQRDNLHAFVYQLTLKLSISALTDEEADRVIRHLRDNLRAVQNEDAPPMRAPGAITKEQAGKIFGLMYGLQALDNEPSKAALRERLGGVIKKAAGIEPPKKGDILKGLSYEQGIKIIEELKRYTRSAKRNQKRKAAKQNEHKGG